MKADKTENTENPVELTGTVVKKKFAKGSKSEHDAVYLQTNDGSYLLRRLGGNPFSDPVLQKLIGKKIRATGRLNEYFFLANKLKNIP